MTVHMKAWDLFPSSFTLKVHYFIIIFNGVIAEIDPMHPHPHVTNFYESNI